MISSEIPDWERERRTGWVPSKSLLASIRAYQRARGTPGLIPAVQKRVAILRHRFWTMMTGADIPLNARLGGGLLLPHPNGIVIHPDAEIGPNCLFFQQVTIGAAKGGVPTIGGQVDIGAGAKIIGAVVITDVPEGATAVGNPARILFPKVAVSLVDSKDASAEVRNDMPAIGRFALD
jgi:serine O-acetyltransferase